MFVACFLQYRFFLKVVAGISSCYTCGMSTNTTSKASDAPVNDAASSAPSAPGQLYNFTPEEVSIYSGNGTIITIPSYGNIHVTKRIKTDARSHLYTIANGPIVELTLTTRKTFTDIDKSRREYKIIEKLKIGDAVIVTLPVASFLQTQNVPYTILTIDGNFNQLVYDADERVIGTRSLNIYN